MPPRKRFSPRRGPRRDQGARPPRRAPEAGGPKTAQTAVQERPAKVTLSDSTPVADLAALINMSTGELIGELFGRGIVTNINSILDFDTAALLLSDLKIDAEVAVPAPADADQPQAVVDTPEPQGEVGPRPPVVTVMGHVDHGKTTLLDAIRKTKIAAGEVGGITQSIGAYQVQVGDEMLTFIDTPGHEAFTAMRARGTQVTDIVVLVVAADDGVMPQTREAIGHAKSAGVPIVVAINKKDLQGANPQRALAQLGEAGLLVESHGGDVVHVEVSAAKGDAIDDLLEMVLLTAQLNPPTARSTGPARGTVIETRLDRSMGPVATVLVTAGVLEVGEAIVVGIEHGRVRALLDAGGNRVKRATPSQPVALIGLGGLPRPGDTLAVVDTDKLAKLISDARRQRVEHESSSVAVRLGLEDLALQLAKGEIHKLNLIVKADTDGSAEAVVKAVGALGEDRLKVNVVYSGVGTVTESDINLAVAAKGIVVAFNVKAHPSAATLAETNGIAIQTYQIIYELIEDIQKTLEGRLEPEIHEVIDGRLEIRGVFRSDRNLKIIGGLVTEGHINRGASVRLMRKGEMLAVGRVETLRRFADPAAEVSAGYECGLGVSVQPAVQLGDIIETFHAEEVRPRR